MNNNTLGVVLGRLAVIVGAGLFIISLVLVFKKS